MTGITGYYQHDGGSATKDLCNAKGDNAIRGRALPEMANRTATGSIVRFEQIERGLLMVKIWTRHVFSDGLFGRWRVPLITAAELENGYHWDEGKRYDANRQIDYGLCTSFTDGIGRLLYGRRL